MAISSFDGGALTFPRMSQKVIREINKYFALHLTAFHLDLSHSDTRLSVQLNGFELHIYNRSDLYDQLERTFGMQPSVLIPVSRGPKENTKDG